MDHFYKNNMTVSELFMHDFTTKIIMLILAKVLSIAFLKWSTFTKYLFIKLLQQTDHELYNSWITQLEIEGVWKNTKYMPTSMMLKFGLTTIFGYLQMSTFSAFLFREYNSSGLPLRISNISERLSLPINNYEKSAFVSL